MLPLLLFSGRVFIESVPFPLKCFVEFTIETDWARCFLFQKIVNCSFSVMKK